MRSTFLSLLAIFVFSCGAWAEDALDQIQAKGKITICADPYNWPHSSSSDWPRGFDVELFERIASRNEWQIDVYWSNTGTRGGLGRAMRNSISKGRCHLFAGIAVNADTIEEMGEKRLQFSSPYVGIPYVAVVNPVLAEASSIGEISAQSRIGVAMSTAMDGYLIDNGIDRALYLGNRRVLDGLATGEIDAAFVWAPALAIAKRFHRDADFVLADNIAPIPGIRWNVAAAIPRAETRLIERINQDIAALLEDGTMEAIVESYGVPFFAPFAE